MEVFIEPRNILLTFTRFFFERYLCRYTHLSVYVHVYMYMFGEGGCLQWSEESTGFPGTGIRAGCEPPYVDAGNRTL